MRGVWAFASLVVLLMCAAAPAGQCWGYPASRVVWCDDFDNYFDSLGQPDNAALWAQWPRASSCGSNWTLSADPEVAWDMPFCAMYPGGVQAVATRHAHDLTSKIQNLSPGNDAINGSDSKPLILRMIYNFMPEDVGAAAIDYTELVLDNGDGQRAPTDYVWRNCGGEPGPYPVICQQDRTYAPGVNAFCPSLAAGPLPGGVWPSLAAGPNALLDTDPCDAVDGSRPAVPHLCVFDGKQWFQLVSGRFPGNGGDFHLEWKINTLQMTIRAGDFDVELWGHNRETGEDVHSKATIPRQYLGPFNRIGHGMGAACELNVSTGGCASPSTCFNYNQTAQEAWPSIAIDTAALVDGVLTVQQGACCTTDGACSEVSRASCLAAGSRYHGTGSRCDQVICCRLPFADADHDGDVDQDDFGAFQICYTGQASGVPSGCTCFNRDNDSNLDVDDFTSFANCWTGPNVPWSAGLTPSCTP